MSDFRRFCFMYAFVCVGSCIACWATIGKPMNMASMISTMFIASIGGAVSVIVSGRKDANS